MATIEGDGYIGPSVISAGSSASFGTVLIDYGSYLTGSMSSASFSSAIFGTITVDGPSTTVEVGDGSAGTSGNISVANEGTYGYLNITGGASVVSTNGGYWNGYDVVGGYANASIGFGYGSYGRVTVNGAGSELIAQGSAARITLGRFDGFGYLDIRNGGVVETLILDVGSSGGIGGVNIDYGGTLRITNNSGLRGAPVREGLAGEAIFGRDNGIGALYMSGGAQFIVENSDGLTDTPMLRFGLDNGSYGFAYISGAGTAVNVIQHGPQGDDFGGGARLDVGAGGQGYVRVEDNAQINVLGDGAYLGIARGAFGGGSTTALPSLLVINSGADVLVDSQGYGGGAYGGIGFGSRVLIAGQSGTVGEIVVDGPGSTLTVATSSDVAGDYGSGELRVGSLGEGTLTVSNGGAVSARELQVASFSASTGYGSFTTGYLADVAYSGRGTVNITGGGTVTITATDNTAYRGVRVGEATGTIGAINVDGPGSTLTSQDGGGFIRVGRFGTAELNVTGGGEVNGFFLDVGREDGSDGRVSVDGIGSVVNLSDEFGQFTLDPGFGGFLRLGRNAGSYGRLDVTNGGTVNVINDPSGIRDVPGVTIGRNNGALGVLVVDGEGSSLSVEQTGPIGDYYAYGAEIEIGDGGQGLATVSNDGAINVFGDAAGLLVAGGRYDGYGAPDNTTEQSLLQILSGGDVTVDAQGYGGFFPTMGGADSEFRGGRVVVGGGPRPTGASSSTGRARRLQ